MFFIDAFDFPNSSTPNFADPLGYNRFEQSYGGNGNFVPFVSAVGFGFESHGAFGRESFSGINNHGQYAAGFSRNNQFSHSYGNAAFSSYVHIGNNMNGDRATGFTNMPFGPYSSMNMNTAINQPSANAQYTGDDRTTITQSQVKSEEKDKNRVLSLAKKENRND